MLAIATPDPDSTPETYVRQHIRSIAPENTVVLYWRGEGRSLAGMPGLKITQQWRFPIMRKLQSAGNFIVHAYPGVIAGSAARQVEQFLTEHRVQSILAEFGPTGAALLPLARKLGIRLVVNFHGHDATVMPRRWVIRRAYRRLNRGADAFICGSSYFKNVLTNLGFSEDKINIVPCGIEVDQFTAAGPKDPHLVVAVGRLVPKKAPQLTIQAFARVLGHCPEARLEIIGDGSLWQDCQALIDQLELGQRVTLHGAKSHEFVRQKLAGAGLFVQHSVTAPNGDTESQGISLLEAMASGLPVVATCHNGFVETVQESVTGFLVDERDVSGMADRMIQILNDSHLRDRMGKAGRQRVIENYKAGKMAERLHDLLEI